uniref:Cilia- and flagella-associated protein 45 n=1 Tax=Salarias fasciatus TaxID=181472 RepID=A0A672FRM6_SALFA
RDSSWVAPSCQEKDPAASGDMSSARLPRLTDRLPSSAHITVTGIKPVSDKKSSRRPQWKAKAVIDKHCLPIVKAPRKPVSTRPLYLPSTEKQRISSASRTNTEDHAAMKQQKLEMMAEERQAAAERKKPFLEDKPKQKFLSADAQAHRERLMNPALITNIGLHDTLKPIDDKIVYTKFQNQRHSQVENKRKTEAECREEEKRMHSMRDSERLRALEVEKDMAKKRREQEVTVCQINSEEAKRRADMEAASQRRKLLQETALIQNEQEKLELERSTAKRMNRMKELHLCGENEQISAEAKQAQQKVVEEERLEDLKIADYIEEKDEEVAQRKMQRKHDADFDLFLKFVIAKQSHHDQQTNPEQEEFAFRQRQLIEDHEWRQQNAKAAQEKRDNTVKLRTMRLQAILESQHHKSLEAGREETEVNEVLSFQKEAAKQEQEQRARRHEKDVLHDLEVRNQIERNQLKAAARRRKTLKEERQGIEEQQHIADFLKEMRQGKRKTLQSLH